MDEKFESHNMTLFYQNPCFNEVHYKGTVLLQLLTLHLITMQGRVGSFSNMEITMPYSVGVSMDLYMWISGLTHAILQSPKCLID